MMEAEFATAMGGEGRPRQDWEQKCESAEVFLTTRSSASL